MYFRLTVNTHTHKYVNTCMLQTTQIIARKNVLVVV